MKKSMSSQLFNPFSLNKSFVDFVRWIAESEETDGGCLITKDNIPDPQLELATDSLVIQKSSHSYGSFAIDCVDIFGSKLTLRYLGVLILSAVFKGPDIRVKITLSNSKSQIRTLVIVWEPSALSYPLSSNYHTVPSSFDYSPIYCIRHPWDPFCGEANNLPVVELTNQNEMLVTLEDWNRRDLLKGFGTDVGNILFAELLLSASYAKCEETEVFLETEGGFRGVGPLSPEIRIFTPGNERWNNTYSGS